MGRRGHNACSCICSCRVLVTSCYLSRKHTHTITHDHVWVLPELWEIRFLPPNDRGGEGGAGGGRGDMAPKKECQRPSVCRRMYELNSTSLLLRFFQRMFPLCLPSERVSRDHGVGWCISLESVNARQSINRTNDTPMSVTWCDID